MIKRFVIIFKIGRKLAQSGILDIFSNFHEVPKSIRILFYLLSFSLKKRDEGIWNYDDEYEKYRQAKEAS